MSYCNRCGAPTKLSIPDGDNKHRDVCMDCGTVHYQNPRIIAGCVVASGDKVLMCKRAIEPRYGFWTLPAGFMENGETTEQAACRETMEEACAHVLEPTLYQVFSIPHISQVHMYYRGTLEDRFAPGEESLEVRLFSAAEVPWNDIAFPTVKKTLKHYFEDLASGMFTFRDENIVPPGQHAFDRDAR